MDDRLVDAIFSGALFSTNGELRWDNSAPGVAADAYNHRASSGRMSGTDVTMELENGPRVDIRTANELLRQDEFADKHSVTSRSSNMPPFTRDFSRLPYVLF